MKLIPGHTVLGPRLSFTCQHCGKTFERRPGYVRAKPVRYCSADCREAAKKRPPVVIDEEIAHIPLTKGLIAIIDTADVGLVSGFTWYASAVGGDRHYARTHLSGGRNEYLHRILLGIPSGEVDHVDGNTLNNRRANLRLATSSQNKANRDRWQSRSLPKGVYETKTGRFEAKIARGSERIFLGVYDTPEEAAAAYDKAAIDLFGVFARPNSID